MDKKFDKILVILMAAAVVALPILYSISSSAEGATVDGGIVGSDGTINNHPGIMRLHIIANSDSEEDQALKLRVRNYILAKVQNEIATEIRQVGDSVATAADETAVMREYIRNNLDQIEVWAEDAIEAAPFLGDDFDYGARVSVGIRHIPAKYYDDMYFPEGNYEALTITLGEGNGRNWWCVVFPPLCLIDSSDSPEGELIIEEEGKLELKSKIAELMEDDQAFGGNSDSDGGKHDDGKVLANILKALKDSKEDLLSFSFRC